jgi:nitrite reductase (NADH) large subunit
MAALQDTNDHFLANLQRNGTCSWCRGCPAARSPRTADRHREIARDFGLYTKITGGQRIDLFGARVEELP